MRTIRITIEYDGTEFAGWQFQKNARSVQEIIETALSRILQENIRVAGAGRTDAGVHAKGQVAHFSTNNSMEPALIVRGANAVLPEDVVLLSAAVVSDEFHARFSATGRKYRYMISQSPLALGRKYAWYLGHPLDEKLLEQCANAIVGDHDFSAFSKVDTEVKNFRCHVRNAVWRREGTMLYFEIEANRFLYGMVRALVGTMVDVGRGHRTFDDFGKIMRSGERKNAGMAAPAAGLVLLEVTYAQEGG